MSYRIYIGNLAFDTSSEELKELFEEAGEVKSVSIISGEELKNEAEDPALGYLLPFISQHERKGQFGFVEMRKLAHAKSAIERFQGIELPRRPGSFLVLSGPHGGDKKP